MKEVDVGVAEAMEEDMVILVKTVRELKERLGFPGESMPMVLLCLTVLLEGRRMRKQLRDSLEGSE